MAPFLHLSRRPPDGTPPKESNWQTTLWVMVAVQFLMSAGQSMVQPLLPLFLKDELHLAQGQNVELWAGIIASAHFLTMTFFSPLWGSLADRYGRRVMVIRSSAGVGVFNLITILVANQYQLLGVRLCMGMFSGFASTATALVASQAPKERLGYALGLLGTGSTAGTVFGPLLGGVLSSAFGFRAAFLSTGITSLVACTLTATMVHENFRPPTREQLAARPSLVRGMAAMARSRDLSVMFVVFALSRMTIGGLGPMSSLYVGELGVVAALVPTVAGMAVSVTGFGSALTAPVLGRMADRVGYKPVLLGALAATSLAILPQAWVTSSWQYLALRFLQGLCVGGVQPAAYAIIGRVAPRDQQSTAYGLTVSATSIGHFCGPLLSGLVASALGLRPVFIYTGILVAVNAMWVTFAVRRVGGPEDQKPGTPAPQTGAQV